ncbi:MAG: hypothetical protein ACJ731_10810 [Vicinamibacterales bacterium]
MSVIAVSAIAIAVSAQRAGVSAVHTLPISYADARPALAAHADTLPAALRGKSELEPEAAWAGWVTQPNAQIRGASSEATRTRSFFCLYGTSFTTLPRAADRDLAQLGDRGRIAELLEERLEHLVAGVVNRGTNERLRFARQVIERHGIKVATAAGDGDIHAAEGPEGRIKRRRRYGTRTPSVGVSARSTLSIVSGPVLWIIH